MKFKAVIAKAIAKIALKSAKVACGSASCYGVYQPKEPENLKDLVK